MSVYRTRAGLCHRFRDVLNFYYPNCLDTAVGGYVAQLDERDGHVYDARTKHLVATARGVHNFSLGVLADGPHWCEHAAEHGLQFLSTVHWDDARRGYDWLLDGRTPTDRTRYCYGTAFALLAAARALQAGIPGARDELEHAFGVLEGRFWEPDRGRYATCASPDWELASYRGQNANMHACEALLAAYEATGADRFLDRRTPWPTGLHETVPRQPTGSSGSTTPSPGSRISRTTRTVHATSSGRRDTSPDTTPSGLNC